MKGNASIPHPVSPSSGDAMPSTSATQNSGGSSVIQLFRSGLFVLLAFVLSAYAFPFAQRVASEKVPAAAAAMTATDTAPTHRVERHSDAQDIAPEDKLALGLATLAAIVVVQGFESVR